MATGILFPHQLSEQNSLVSTCDTIYLIEEWLFFKQYNFHKQKICFHRASLKFYESYLQSKNIWLTTIEQYTDRVQKVALWLQENKSKSLEQAEKKDVLDYLQYLNEKLNYTARSSQQVVGILKHYYTFLCQNEQTAGNPVLLIKLRGTSKRIMKKLC